MQIERFACIAKEGKLNYTARQFQMLLKWRCFLGDFGLNAKNAKVHFTRTFYAQAETARYFIGGRKRRKTWLRLRCSSIGGSSESVIPIKAVSLAAVGVTILLLVGYLLQS
ncbi:DNA polymerase delta catalytic subunit [Apostasia shenzhenica]|uniref:DNA polymerase delta catalytic subunit n=1 Tax=Apostasia shenzhenica TaxID=1088818 RepID=A0A2I0ANH8_9ASPA|nr:DNA polymerase delta catalytic subunit [Apostasia shenzhenica]